MSLPLFSSTTKWNFQKLPSYTFYRENVVRVPVLFFFSLPLIFTPVVASIFLFSPHRYKLFMFFFQRNWSSLVFISRSSSLSVIHVNVDIEIKPKERIGFCCCCFYLQKTRKLRDLPPKRAGAWNAKFHPGLHERVDVSTDVPRTDDFLRTKISWRHRLPKFVTHGALLRARERAPPLGSTNCNNLLVIFAGVALKYYDLCLYLPSIATNQRKHSMHEYSLE